MTAKQVKLDAIHLRDGVWAVRPEGCLGTCGWVNGQPWTVQYIRASSPEMAIRKANANARYSE